MIQALNMPYSSKRDEIMSRYRPIAPKPELSNTNNGGIDQAQLVPEKFRQSPYLRDIWSHLQARPTRTRKRGRTAGISPAAAAAMLRNQQHQHHQHQQQQKMLGYLPSHASNLTFHACGIYGGDNQHANYNVGGNLGKNNINESIIELPLLSGTPLFNNGESKGKSIDLNTIDDEVNGFEEKDYLSLNLQIPTTTTRNTTSNVISPRPVRPVGSIISIVGPIGEDPEAGPIVNKSAEKVEEEVDKETLPAVISDRGNKVRMANSAYKELIGQPECPWLNSMVSLGSGSRISGEVMIRFGAGKPIPGSGNGFSCWVRIEWESEGEKKYVNAFSEVVRLACESKDYVYYWRFHTREVSPSGSNV
ncbi:uncharacterized protein LOC141587939 [Silene latifolia]|uniref:uncharacterized protein LOC141587939 n=1 Tax=Silene latifolia TaxID=37657 RepID=UPI003D779650